MAIDTSRLPADAASLDPVWLTQALRSSGVLSSNSFVAACNAQQLGAGAGLIGMLARAQLTYGGAPTDAPTRMICKFPSTVAANRAVADAFDMYGREVRFYQSLAETTSIGHPRCYFAVSAPSTSDFVLLLEDLGDRRIGDQVLGSTLARRRDRRRCNGDLSRRKLEPHRRATLCVANLARERSADRRHGGRFCAGLAALSVGIFNVDPAERDALGPPRRAEHARRSCDALCSGPQTICHADFRLENMFFAATEEQPDFAIVDWQSITKSSGAQDLAYFLTQSVVLDVRRRHERDLLARYLEGLRAGGVRGILGRATCCSTTAAPRCTCWTTRSLSRRRSTSVTNAAPRSRARCRSARAQRSTISIVRRCSPMRDPRPIDVS